ncbi:MAG: Rod shape-determining protein MreB [Parcubacteria group bacterium GW2011_GWA2_47_12]|nr:MAG: Rod shape-determining protein MreB [Parcubacteria group bacterium GW2011_GWA2_47_12]
MIREYWDKIKSKFSNDIAIDLGTANTLVYVRGKGIVINEPSVVAVNQKTNQVVAVGSAAKEMLGRTPQHIIAVKPMVGGVISDFEITEEMLAYLLRRAEGGSRSILGPRVIVGVPAGVTNVETRAVRDATESRGAREVFLVDEALAAAVGMRLPIKEPIGTMVVDIGGGTSDIVVVSMGGIVRSKGLKIAGDRFNGDIINFIRAEHKVLIGEKTAESVKIALGSAIPLREALQSAVRGRDIITGLPREIVVTDSDVRDALAPSLDILLESIREVLEGTPPELVSDIMRRGVHVVGGGALLRGLSEMIEEHMKIPVHIGEEPLTAVARGAGIILERLDEFSDLLTEPDSNELPPPA